jgi:L-ascorbate metabolism protein UlaG (beta-lactamase superfamily)
VDLILVTHGHSDHTRDLVELAQMTGATVVANFEFALQLVALGVIDAKKVIPMNKGGTVAPLGRGIKVHMVAADHSTAVNLSILGLPENGFKIYHSGDTNVFGDMALIREFHQPDLALICIGGHFTMDPEGAAYAVRELIKPKQVIPIHYGTFPIINRTPAEFKAALGNAPVEVLDVKPGQAVTF